MATNKIENIAIITLITTEAIGLIVVSLTQVFGNPTSSELISKILIPMSTVNCIFTPMLLAKAAYNIHKANIISGKVIKTLEKIK